MGLVEALISLNGLSLGDAFGQSLYSPAANALIERRELPPGPWRWTDDTLTALSVVEDLREREWVDQDYLARRMAWRYTIDPYRGYGPGTRQILERIAQGEYFRSVSRSVFADGSYGSAAAARAVPIGAYFNTSEPRAAREARLAAAITHSHEEAQVGAVALAAAASMLIRPDRLAGKDLLEQIIRFFPESRVRRQIELAASIPGNDRDQAVDRLHVGRDSTVLSVVPFGLWCAAYHLDNYEEALWWTVAAPGIRDTHCAIVGGLVALTTPALPLNWQERCEPLPGDLPDVLETLPVKDAAGSLEILSKPTTASPADASRRVSGSIRVDPLTGLPNLLGLLEWGDRGLRGTAEPGRPFSLVAVQLVALWEVNRIRGHAAGDALLRSYARMLRARAGELTFRSGGDKFTCILPGEFDAFEMARQFGMMGITPELPPCRIAVIHFSGPEEASPGKIVACLQEGLANHHYEPNDGTPREFWATLIRSSADYSWVSADLAEQFLRIGRMADEAARLSETDSVSQLPNMRAALNALDLEFDRARLEQRPLAVLMIDGDNLRRFNQISYRAGDEVIRQMGTVLKGQLRPGDFLARWRSGDEFLILLPGIGRKEAVQFAQELCGTIVQASRTWLFPTSISIGIAVLHDHGWTVQDLLDQAEKGLKKAKESGKNRVVMIDSARI